jgi:deoxyribodipyrimidine photolyase-related protein
MAEAKAPEARHLVMVLGDQLNPDSAAFDGFDCDHDAVLMAEVAEEATYVPQHAQRLVLFFSGMRHLRDRLSAMGRRVHYVPLDGPANQGSLGAELGRWIRKTRAKRVIVVKPGDYRVEMSLRQSARGLDCPLEIRGDRHFICRLEDFDRFAAGRRTLVLETFYRWQRREQGILMAGREPAGGTWNFDRENRASFGARGPEDLPQLRSFPPDRLTREVITLVRQRFARHPGHPEGFDYPVTADQAQAALEDFVSHRLRHFGRFQDAMATGHPYLYHSRLAAALNLHLLAPRVVIDRALEAFAAGTVPINSVEGFVRQILGWREYIRGVYWHEMPGYGERNALEARAEMPRFMWDGDTDMRCVRESVGQLIEHAYAHHIQRLMVLGQYALLLGVRPLDVHRWHLAMFADAVDWVSLPNVLGMSQYADGGIVGTKPYCASGAYIRRMSDYCGPCRFDPKQAVGRDACPFTTLYWDFLARNRERLQGNRRMGLQLKNLARKSAPELRDIAGQAKRLRRGAASNRP